MGTDCGSGGGSSDVVGGLLDGVRRLAERDLDVLDEPEIRRELKAIEEARRRLEARQIRAAEQLTRRRRRRYTRAGEDPTRAGRKAERETERELADELSWRRSDARRATRVGRQMEDAPVAGEAFDAGRLSPAHARLLADTLAWLTGEQREEAEAQLLEHAREEDPVTFGKSCRRLLAQLDHESATRAEERRRSRRYARVTTTDDGMTAVSGQWSGLDGEYLQSAIHAFRRHDAPGEHRTPEQATADAVVDMARAALRAAMAPTQHGVRPHAIVTIPYEAVLREAGVVDAAFTGPLPYSEIRRMLADCGISRLLLDAHGVPVEAGEQVRSVPVGVVRGLQMRDKVCIADGCDVPAMWCEVMHLDTPYRLGGRLTIATAAFGCSYHHGKLDRQGWEVTWHDGRPVLHPPGRPPRSTGPAPEEQAGADGTARPTGQGSESAGPTEPTGPDERGRRGAVADREGRGAPGPVRPASREAPTRPTSRRRFAPWKGDTVAGWAAAEARGGRPDADGSDPPRYPTGDRSETMRRLWSSSPRAPTENRE